MASVLSHEEEEEEEDIDDGHLHPSLMDTLSQNWSREQTLPSNANTWADEKQELNATIEELIAELNEKEETIQLLQDSLNHATSRGAKKNKQKVQANNQLHLQSRVLQSNLKQLQKKYDLLFNKNQADLEELQQQHTQTIQQLQADHQQQIQELQGMLQQEQKRHTKKVQQYNKTVQKQQQQLRLTPWVKRKDKINELNKINK